MSVRRITFNKNDNAEFYSTLKKRVEAYFAEEGISKYGNAKMYAKTVAMITMYLTPFIIMLTPIANNNWVFFGCWALMAFGMAGIGLSVMHDANHGSYSKKRSVNKWLGRTINFLGGHSTNWRIQHNVLHHTYTNVDEMDHDIDSGLLVRFSPNQPLHKIHRFQFIYTWFLYGMMTILWCTIKDWKNIYRYTKLDLMKTQNTSLRKEFISLLGYRAFYYLYILVVPLIIVSQPWWMVFIGFFMMHYMVGVILASIFQTAHVMEDSSYTQSADTTNIENSWAVHQILNTSNYAPKSKLFSWYVGGLNFQIEHHLFPTICHVHYPKLSGIVKEVTEQFNLPYYEHRTFWRALVIHGKTLYQLGRA